MVKTCTVCNRNIFITIDNGYRKCISCGSYFNENSEVIDGYDPNPPTKEAILQVMRSTKPEPKFDGLGIA